MTYAVPPTRREAVVNQLRAEIVTGELADGTVIKDAELAARLGVSITPVREAIAQLATEGLIDIAPNRTRRVTEVNRKNALELIDVMEVLACAGFEWGMDHLTEDHLVRMAGCLDSLVDHLRRGDSPAAIAMGAEFSTIVISASGNRELQTHVDLVVARTVRLLRLTARSDIWPVWLHGYRETLDLLRQGEHRRAATRYRQIYTEYRALLETLPLGPSVETVSNPAG